jgi:hypothetical protein
MPTPEQLEEYRRMTPGERLSLTSELTRKYQHCLFKGTPYQIARRFERMRNPKEEANRRILEALARSKRYEEKESGSDDVPQT